MSEFVFFGINAVEWLVLAYFLIGAYSLGYLLLRTGWPKVRILDESYRMGWSIIFGTVFSALWMAATFVLGVQKIFPIVLTITLVTTLIVLSLRRRIAGYRTASVSVPKEKAAQQALAEQSIRALSEDRDFILNRQLNQEQVEKIKQALERSGLQ